jgi:hypothetical protein
MSRNVSRQNAGRARTRRTIPLALVVGAVLGACEHPLPPRNPSPLEIAAEHFDVPVAVLRDLQQTADRLERSLPAGTSVPDASATEVQRLREALRRLEEEHRAEGNTP